MTQPLIIAIDGGAGTGTSTAAEGAAKALNIPHLNTGSMYRAIAWECQRRGLDLHDDNACGGVAEAAHIELENGAVSAIDGHDVREKLYTDGIGRITPIVAGLRRVRFAMVKLQREVAQEYGGVLEGRDIGTNVFPDTPHKFWFTCDPEERLRRLHAGGRTDETIDTLLARDTDDAAHEHGTFKRHDDAIEIDTTHISRDEVVQKIVDHVHAVKH